ncbi:MAG: hypothetical protein J6Z11_04215 [Candidatus Riflebacteria bacterium]|nr:hypothetical protein [Candidatus Riflebacteria bacterium]
MTNLMDVTPSVKTTDNEKTTVKTEATVSKPATMSKPPRAEKPLPTRTREVEAPSVKWIRLVKGGTYGYKRAIYEQGKTYEVDIPTAEHLLAQYYTLGNANETIDVYYFEEVKRK